MKNQKIEEKVNMKKESEYKTSKKTRIKRKKYFHEFEKLSLVVNIAEFGRTTIIEQGFCCVCDSMQTYAQSLRRRKTCGDRMCINACRSETFATNKKDWQKLKKEMEKINEKEV